MVTYLLCSPTDRAATVAMTLASRTEESVHVVESCDELQRLYVGGSVVVVVTNVSVLSTAYQKEVLKVLSMYYEGNGQAKVYIHPIGDVKIPRGFHPLETLPRWGG